MTCAMYYGLQWVSVCCSVLQCVAVCCRVLQCVAVCCSVLQCAAVCCSVLQCVALCCSVLQCVAVCCSVLQCVACVLDSRSFAFILHQHLQARRELKHSCATWFFIRDRTFSHGTRLIHTCYGSIICDMINSSVTRLIDLWLASFILEKLRFLGMSSNFSGICHLAYVTYGWKCDMTSSYEGVTWKNLYSGSFQSGIQKQSTHVIFESFLFGPIEFESESGKSTKRSLVCFGHTSFVS